MIQVSRVFHAGYIFTASDQTRVLFDPIFEIPFATNCFPYPAVTIDLARLAADHFDAVFISHHHDDHFSLPSLDRLDRETPIYLFCRTHEPFEFIRELGFSSVHSLELDETIKVGGFHITPRAAVNRDVDAMFEIEYETLRILNVVDAWIDNETLSELSSRNWDLVLWPFQTMLETDVISPQFAIEADRTLPAEWLEQITQLKPSFVVPSSCQFLHEPGSWINHALFPITYEQFAKEVDRPDRRVVKLDPGATAELTKGSFEITSQLDWISAGVSGDYFFDRDLEIPTTQTLAKNFAAVDDVDWSFVQRFIADELPKRFTVLSESTEIYFQAPCRWNLVVHDSAREPLDFRFVIDGHKIERDVSANKSSDWRTEIIASKLVSSVRDGESLTSLYLRINDGDFSEEIREKLKWVDILADPLVRCLYEKDTHAFQRAQLRRLKNQT